MDTGLLLVAAFCGIWQFVSTTDFGYTLSDTLGQPVLVGALLGIITGQIEQGLLIGGSLELMYLGIIYPGGTVPACASSAALVAIPIALRTGLDAVSYTHLDVYKRQALIYIEDIENYMAELNDDNFHACIASGGGRMTITMDR